MPTDGKISTARFRQFRLEFLKARRNVPDVSEPEARRHLLARLWPSMTEKVIRKEREENSKRPVVSFFPGKKVLAAEVFQMVEGLAKRRPLEVVTKNEMEHWVTFDKEISAEEFLLLNRRCITGCTQNMIMHRVEEPFSVLDIFNVVVRDLETREAIELQNPPKKSTFGVGVEENTPPRVQPSQNVQSGGGKVERV